MGVWHHRLRQNLMVTGARDGGGCYSSFVGGQEAEKAREGPGTR